MVKASEIAKKLGLELIGNDSEVMGIADPSTPLNNHLYWGRAADFVNTINKGVIIIPEEISNNTNPNCTYLTTKKSPRLEFAKAAHYFFSTGSDEMLTNHAALHQLNKKITVGEHCFIGSNVTIGDGSVIYPNTTILSHTEIGENTVIKPNCSIGSDGLGFEFEDGKMYKFPQIGKVIIGNHVEFGPNSVIRKGALGRTIVEDEAKIGSLCNIGHNCLVKQQAILTSQCILAGSSTIGKGAYLGINALIKNKINVGNDATIGMGAVVNKDVPAKETWVGVPAKKIK